MQYCGDFRTTYEKDVEIFQTPFVQVCMGVLFLSLLALPFLVKGEYLWIALQILIAVIGAVGLNILTGFTGQISLGQGAFLGVGAYTLGVPHDQARALLLGRRTGGGIGDRDGGDGLRHPVAASQGALPRHRHAGVPVHPRMGFPAVGAGDRGELRDRRSRVRRSGATSSSRTAPSTTSSSPSRS